MKLLYKFFRDDSSGGVLLIIAAAFSMVLANLDLTKGLYQAFLNIPVEFRIGTIDINKNMLLLINDALMAIFFLLIGLEVKRELLQGSLATRHRASFPVIAALGGMLIPSLIYLVFNYTDLIFRRGWAIPATTDIAFALGVLALLGKNVPLSLKVFLMALAIIDDLGAIIIIAMFYASHLSLLSLSVAIGAIMTMALLNIFNVRRIGVYILVDVILWVAVLKSGVHATLAGVIVGFFIPLKEELGKSPAKQLENVLHPWVTFIILPLFAFANAGISFQDVTISCFNSTLPLGIIIGLFMGKPLGISLFCWLAIKFRLSDLPKETTFQQIMAIGVLCGIGFTMSIFISSLAFDAALDPKLIVLAKFGVLIGSILSAFSGYTLLKIQLSK